MYVTIDLKNNVAKAFKDLKQASKEVGSTYKTLKRHFDKFGHYEKGYFRVFWAECNKSSRGNPNF